MSKIGTLLERLGTIPSTTGEKAVRAKSRDFFWYSPVLKERLDHITADVVVTPRNEAEVIIVLAACFALDIAVTPRGAGTGNYGQAMPLAGGVVLDMSAMTLIHEMTGDLLSVEPGALMGEIDAHTKAEVGRELRMHPSTRETATIGGFIAGGSGGVGSIRWGMLSTPGNVLALRLVTMEAEPRVIDITGTDVIPALHSYGTCGIITRITLPLAPAPDWVDMLVAYDNWQDCLEAGQRLASTDGLWLKQLGAVQAPAPHDFFRRHAKFLNAQDNVLIVMAAPQSVDTLADIAQAAGGRVAYRQDTATEDAAKGLPHIYHLGWNHTTLRALKTDPAWTYLQIGLRDEDEIAACLEIAQTFEGEIINHVEFTRGDGKVRMSALPLLRFSTQARLVDVMGQLEQMGCMVWNPHAYTLEEGGHHDADPDLITRKRAHDPKGLLNPGKMIGWDNPDYTYDPAGGYHYEGTQKP